MSQDPLDYQILLQDALRSLVRRSLEIVAEQGFSGDHHFFLSFRTGAPGVDIPQHLRDTYPDEMTIVLKTQFKDLTVSEEAFSVGLFFSSVLYYLTIPFDALVAFTDPSVGFQLVFQDPADAVEETPTDEADASAEQEASSDASADASADDLAEAEPEVDNVVAFSSFRKR